jgi:hypothetical protein
MSQTSNELNKISNALSLAIAALQSIHGKHGGTAGNPYGRRRHLSAAARKRISNAMKRDGPLGKRGRN